MTRFVKYAGSLLTNNAQVLQYLWSQTLRDDTHSKLLVGLDSNPAIIST